MGAATQEVELVGGPCDGLVLDLAPTLHLVEVRRGHWGRRVPDPDGNADPGPTVAAPGHRRALYRRTLAERRGAEARPLFIFHGILA